MKATFLKLFIFLSLIFLIKALSNEAFAQKIYSCDSKYDAKKKIYFVDSKYDADLLIFFVDNKYDAKWNNKSKKYLIY